MNKITINNFVPQKVERIDTKCFKCGRLFQTNSIDSVVTIDTSDSKCKVECVCPHCGATCFVKFDCE